MDHTEDQNNEDKENTEEFADQEKTSDELHKIVHLSGMYKDWFLDYASYVILERAVPHLMDGLKPVQRRIMHAMKRLDDGRYNKVANIIGYTMQYHLTAMLQLAMHWFSWDRRTYWLIHRVTGEIF